MEWLGELFGFGASVASGGVLGVLGGFGSSIMKYFSQKQEFKQKQAEWEHKKEMMRLQTEGAVTQASWDALSASHQADARSNFEGRWAIVDAIKTLYRPFLTTALFVLVYFLFQDILSGLSNKETVVADIFTGDELKEIMRYMVYSIVFTTSSAGMWWFSERAFTPPGMKNR